MRHIIIGDIHGCLGELEELLVLLSLQQTDRLYFIGDLIDRGPDSAGVVRRVRRLSEENHVTLILGNHEEKFLRYLNNAVKNPHAASQMKGVEKYALLSSELVDEDVRFLRGSYYTKIIDAGKRLLLLHGGIPATSKLDLGQEYAYQGSGGKSPKGLELLTRTRHLDANGNFLSMDMQREDSPYWADVYDGRWGFVVFGHEPFIQEQPRAFGHALGIDTGCVFGGWLTAVSIPMEVKALEFERVGVKASHPYSHLRDD